MKGLGFLSGALIGSAGVGIGVLKLFQNHMVKEIPSPKNFEDTCETIERVVPEFAKNGWGFPIEKWNFYKVFEDKNIEVKDIKKLCVYFICNAKLAAKVINANNAMAGMMPCSWAVMEKTDGKTYISKMNVELMSKAFVGDIRDAMKKVVEFEKEMLKRIFK